MSKNPSKPVTRFHVRLEKSGEPTQEWYFDNPKKIKMGYHIDNHVWLPIPEVEPHFDIIEKNHRPLTLRIPDHYKGLFLSEQTKISLQSLKTNAAYKKQKSTIFIPLAPKTQVMVELGGYKVIFWMSQPPAKYNPFSLSQYLSQGLKNIPKFFASMVVLSFLIHIGILLFLKKIPGLHTVIAPSSTSDFRNISIKQLGEIDKALKEQLEKAASMGIKIGGNKISRPSQPIDASGFIQAVAAPTKNESNSSFSSLFTTQSFTKDLNKALNSKSFGDVLNTQMKNFNIANAFGVGVPGTPTTGSAEGAGLAQAPTVSGGTGAPSTQLSFNKSTAPVPTVSQQPIVNNSTGKLDSQVVSSILGQKQGELTSCYESALAANPQLKTGGRLMLEFMIGLSGKPEAINVSGSSLSDASLKECLKRKVSGWTFPAPKGGMVPVKLPLIFSTSS